MIRLFTRYASVGVVNTLLHWMVFGALYEAGLKQSASNLVAFTVAVTFSFFANAKWTFGSKVTKTRYILYVVFMGALALTVGWAADIQKINPIITLIVFSAISLVCGFVYSKLIVFREAK
ncbi:GtrA family protein [Enterobacteriaceae bacterium RIT691]|nr:GtrA family protein [Enterobacteriaceae bacterium RIT691]